MAPTARPVKSADTPPKIAINLDSLERENPSEPFVAVVGGERLTFTDPQEIPWQDLLEIDDPEAFARLCLAEEQRPIFLETRMPAWKMARLMNAFRDHYGLGELGNVAG